MAVVKVTEQAHLRQGSISYNDPGDSQRVFQVECDSKYDDDGIVLFADDGTIAIPARFDEHPTRPQLRCGSKSCRQVDDKGGYFWEVLVNYSRLPPVLLPWEQNPVYSWSSNAIEVLVERDISTGKHIKNSAGCPFDPAPTVTKFDPILQVQRNELTFDESVAAYYGGTVNSGTFYGYAAGYVMCLPPTATTQEYVYENGDIQTYWAVTYQFQFRNSAFQTNWQLKLLDAGFLKKSGSSLVPITIGGREPSSPVPLNGSGDVLSNPSSATPTFLDFTVYPSTDFSALGV
jgi:hypothetical protein